MFGPFSVVVTESDNPVVRPLLVMNRKVEWSLKNMVIKVKFWSDMIERWAERNKRATFSPAELRDALAGPHCLREVIEAAKFRREDDVR